MEIVTAANNWAKAEIKSAVFFMLFGFGYLLLAVGCRQMDTTPFLSALFIPMLVAGILLLMAGISFYFTNKSKLNSFEADYKATPTAFLDSEIESTAKTIKTYENVALKVFPAIILTALLIAIFVSFPMVKAICVGLVAFLSVLVLLDSQALKRMKLYHQHLKIAKETVVK